MGAAKRIAEQAQQGSSNAQRLLNVMYAANLLKKPEETPKQETIKPENNTNAAPLSADGGAAPGDRRKKGAMTQILGNRQTLG